MVPFQNHFEVMPHLSIKDVPPAWAEALRQRALQHHRSLQGELMAILEQALSAAPPRPAVTAAPEAGLRQGRKTLAQVRQALQARYPRPIEGQSSSVALIREARDSR
ncbi:MAG: FitA-like ribbon-helix-helix domain-containing protein [Curvibacter sp.]|jgi:plasmid stability protein|nr:Arc family DNA-binding protein [Curvibacter sp.]